MQAGGSACAVGEGISEGNTTKAALGAMGFLGSFANLLKVCFAAGTPLLTPTGEKPIEQFRAGDWILTAPEDNPEAPPEAKQVEEVFTGEQAILNLRVGGKDIRTTELHPFWVRGRGWTPAKELIAGDHLRSYDERWVVVESVTNTGEIAAVYNLRIADYHTYFVGKREWGWSVWSHNTCWVRSASQKKDFLKSLANHWTTPSWMSPWLAKGKVPPGYNVDHIIPGSIGGADLPSNMRLVLAADHKLWHHFYHPWR
jgi:hypothetical protein